MQRRGFIKTIGLIVVAVAVIGTIGYVIMQPGIGWPTEDRRVAHPNGGLSVVQPIGWEKSFLFHRPGVGADTIRFVPEKAVGAPGSFSASRISEEVTPAGLDRKGYKPTTFRGQPAYEKWSNYNQTREIGRSVVFQLDGVWCDVSLRRPATETIDGGVWQKYAESIRLEPVKASEIPSTKPAPHLPLLSLPTQPTTAPTP